jgi:hypothetical protein
MLPEYRFKYIKTPFVFITDQYDDFNLGANMGNIWPRWKFNNE